jgi:hypothetical protein
MIFAKIKVHVKLDVSIIQFTDTHEWTQRNIYRHIGMDDTYGAYMRVYICTDITQPNIYICRLLSWVMLI